MSAIDTTVLVPLDDPTEEAGRAYVITLYNAIEDHRAALTAAADAFDAIAKRVAPVTDFADPDECFVIDMLANGAAAAGALLENQDASRADIERGLAHDRKKVQA